MFFLPYIGVKFSSELQQLTLETAVENQQRSFHAQAVIV